jgi:nucleoside-diphosphate-sugar epimerase
MKLDRQSTVFLTGGSGTIGRKILATLNEHQIPAKALARSEGSARIVERLGAEAVAGDLLDPDALLKSMQGAHYLIHAAADTSHGIASTKQDEVNLQGARNVYTAATKAGVRRAVHISSESVLLNGQALKNANETIPIPNTFAGGYSRTKAVSEKIALEYSTPRLEVVVVRPRFVWGLGDTTALPQLIEAAESGKLAWIGGGRYRTSTTHLANVVEGVLLALKRGVAGEVYFISDGEPVEFRDFITRMLETQGVNVPQKEVPRWLVKIVARLGDSITKISRGKLSVPMSWQEFATLGVEVTLNIDKARNELGYEPVITVEEGLFELRMSER